MDEFEQVQSEQKHGYPGWWDRIIPLLDDERRDALDRALHNREISHQTISTVLKRWGHDVSYQQVGHFRRRYVD